MKIVVVVVVVVVAGCVITICSLVQLVCATQISVERVTISRSFLCIIYEIVLGLKNI